jgi:AraC-like DNA-binding protein
MDLQEFEWLRSKDWPRISLDQLRLDLQSACGRFSPDTEDGAHALTGSISVFDAAGLDLVQVVTNAHVVRRTVRDIRLDPREYYFLLIQLEGVCGIEQNDQKRLLAPGDCMLVDSARPSCLHYNSSLSNHLSVHVPRHVALPSRLDAGLLNRPLPAQDHMATVLRALVARMLRTPVSSSRSVDLRSLFLKATGHAFARDEAHTTCEPSCRSSERVERARALVDRHLTDPGLTPRRVASRLGVSLRTLQEDFNSTGGTVGDYIRTRRLRLAHDRLSALHGHARRGTIAEVALESGFNDISYFNRCFRKAFDCSPSDAMSSRDHRLDGSRLLPEQQTRRRLPFPTVSPPASRSSAVRQERKSGHSEGFCAQMCSGGSLTENPGP